MIAKNQRVNIVINELDRSMSINGLYNYATNVDDYEPLYCLAADGSNSLDIVTDKGGNDIYVLKQ